MAHACRLPKINYERVVIKNSGWVNVVIKETKRLAERCRSYGSGSTKGEAWMKRLDN